MHKFLSLFFVLMLGITPAMAEEDDDFSLGDLPPTQTIVLKTTVEDDGTIVEEIEERSIYEEDGSVLITLTATGDFTIGGDTRKSNDIFQNELTKQGGDINFPLRNMRELLLQDDLTLVNFEGTLTNSTYVPSSKRDNSFLFSAPPSYVSMLPDNGIEAVSLENNHVMDHGEDAYNDTQNALTGAGIVWSNSDHAGVIEVKGVQICMLSYLTIDRYSELWTKVPADIAYYKTLYPIVIVSFHWGYELDYAPRDNQIKMGRLAVDSGADLVIGHHSHRINPIEYYNGVYICYSLGNFSFSGNSKPSDMSSFLFQTRFRVRDDVVTNEGFRIIPIRISSQEGYNDFCPTLLTKETSVDSVLVTLKQNGRKLPYAVDHYPLEWE